MNRTPSKASFCFAHRGLTGLGYAAMITLLILSVIFYRERAWFADIAYQTFLLVNDGTVQVQVYRFGAALVQTLPVLAARLGAPLAVISLLYSASFPLLYLVFYFLTVRVLRNDYLGWALVFLFTLIVYDGFYWPTSELQQGLAFLLVFFAFVQRFPALDRPWHWLLLLPGLVALVFYHPLVFIPFFFLWLFFGLCDHTYRHWRYGLLAIAMVILLVLKSKLAANWYDTDKLNTFYTNLQQYYPNYLTLESHRKFLINCLRVWYFFPILLLTISGYYWWRRYWLRLFLVLGFCGGYLMLVHIGSPTTPYRFYAEVNYMPLTIFVAVPFLYDLAPQVNRKTLFALVALVVVWRLAAITYNHRPFTDRLHWLRTTVASAHQNTGGSRFYLPEAEVPLDTLLMTWGTPFETLVMTAAVHPDSARTLLIMPDFERYREELKTDTLVLSVFKPFPESYLDQRYFRIRPGNYQRLPR